MDIRPTVSVIIPAYQAEKYLERCLKSIMDQAYNKLQIIVVDDGSTDATGRICACLAESDARIKIINKKNGGVMSARLKGIDAATGEYIGFVDADDWVDTLMYEKLVTYMENVDIVTSGFYKRYPHGQMKVCDVIPEGVYCTDEQRAYIRENMLLMDDGREGIQNSLCCKLFKTTIVKSFYKSLNPNIVHGEDALFLHNYLLNCTAIRVCHEAYYNYRIHEDSSIQSKDDYFLTKINALYTSLKQLYQNQKDADVLVNKLEQYIVFLVCYGINFKMGFSERHRIPWYIFPFKKEIYNKQIILYGAGKVGRDYHNQISKADNCELILWVDKEASAYQKKGMRVESPNRICMYQYDFVVIAVKDKMASEGIKQELIENGIPACKILWSAPNFIWSEE